jgi:predicted nuclease of predicted toxin-antitoxin system
MMRFVVDANLPPDLARLLKQLGQKAKELNGVIVSKDYDFVMMHQRDQSVSVIYYNRGNIKKSELLAHFSSIMPEIVSALNVGETLIEIT